MVVLYEQHTLTTKAASLMEKSIPLPVNDYMRRHGLFLVKFFSYTSKISVFILIHAKKHFDSQIYIFLTDLLGDYLVCLTKLRYGVLQGLHECKPNPIKKAGQIC